MADNEPDTNGLNRNTILEAEFNYIAQTAYQAHEDRANTTTFYLAAVGSVVVAIFGSMQDGFEAEYINLAFGILFLLVGLAGVRTVFHLVRLRVYWLECVDALNAIKHYYINHMPEAERAAFGAAFLWKKPVEARVKYWSVSFFLATQAIVLGSLSFGAATAFFWQQHFGKFEGLAAWIVAGAVVVGVAGFQLRTYVQRLKASSDSTTGK